MPLKKSLKSRLGLTVHRVLPHVFRDGYLKDSVDPRELGFLCIGLGGSVVYAQSNVQHPQRPSAQSDWDGFGIVETKQQIFALMNEHRAQLCAMLRIRTETSPGLKVSIPPFPDCSHSN